MDFIIDENVPLKLLKVLNGLGHDTTRVPKSSSDIGNVHLARNQKRIFITIDKDLSNTFLFPPSEFDIIHIDIHPPYCDIVINAFLILIKTLPKEKFKGLIILREDGSIHISK